MNLQHITRRIAGFHFLLLSVCLLIPGLANSQTPVPLLVKATDAKGATVLGELKAEDGDNLELLELKTGRHATFQKSALNDLRRGISEKEAATTIGLSEFLVWKTRRVIPGNGGSGKVAQVDAAAIYVTLGIPTGLEKGQELIVYRGNTEIKDPDDPTKVLGPQRRRIAKLLVTEVMDKLSKTRLIGDLDVELKVGDTVEPASFSKPIAILPLVDLQGAVRAGGRKLSEDLTTGLTQGGIGVVERSQLSRVLTELGLQDTKVFDAEKVQKIGKQLGAYAVLLGTLNPTSYGSEANLRLVRVETGEILFATRQDGPGLGIVVEPGTESVLLAPRGATSTPAIQIVPGNPAVSAAQGWKPLFNGEDITGWIRRKPRAMYPWRVKDGSLNVAGPGPRTGDDIYTEKSFWNFGFRCEFMLGKGANSGIFLRGRHEVNLCDDYEVKGRTSSPNGAIFAGTKVSLPLQFASLAANQWQTLEITIVQNRVSVWLNGQQIQNNVECNQASAGGLDANLSLPGPILLQGHTGMARFRNLMIRELR